MATSEFLSYLNFPTGGEFHISNAIEKLQNETKGLDVLERKELCMHLLSEIGKKLQDPRFISYLGSDGIDNLRDVTEQLRGEAAVGESKIVRIFSFIIRTADSEHAQLAQKLDQAELDRFKVIMERASTGTRLKETDRTDFVKLLPRCVDKLSNEEKKYFFKIFSLPHLVEELRTMDDKAPYDAFRKAAREAGQWGRILESLPKK